MTLASRRTVQRAGQRGGDRVGGRGAAQFVVNYNDEVAVGLARG